MFNAFRYAADFSHLFSFVVLVYRLYKSESCAGISLKSQQLYALVFLCRYLDIFVSFSTHMYYNFIFKIVYILLSVGIVYLMRFREPFKSSYENETQKHDTFQTYIIVIPCAVFAAIQFYYYYDMYQDYKELFWIFSIYLEAFAILPQIFVLHYTKKIENLTSHYMFFLGAYRALYIINWIERYLTEAYYWQPFVWTCGIIQTILYVDFFFHYIKAKKEGFGVDVVLPK